jgi:hypothetical protein
MKLFVDDVREPPDATWTVVRSFDEAMQLLPRTTEYVTAVSLDHDLGTEKTGYDVALWLEEMVHVHGMIPPRLLKVHSANPVGRARIMQAFESIARKCEEQCVTRPTIEG